MPELILPAPPVVRQQERHICWAAAYESWCRAQGLSNSTTSASRMVELLAQVGRRGAQGQGAIVDANERLLPNGIPLLAQIAGMRVRLVSPRALSAEFLVAQLGQGYVWLWGTPREGNVAHIVVVHGVDRQERVLYMDPLLGLTQVPLGEMAKRMRIFAVGTPLFPRVQGNPFAGMGTAAAPRPAAPGPLAPFG